MSNMIQYAWGESSLGSFIAAKSDKGLVAFEFAEKRDGVIGAIASKCPGATMIENETALAPTLLRLRDIVDGPDQDQDIEIDPRGTAFEKQVWQMVRNIRPGYTSTYSAIATMMGKPASVRAVANAVGANMIAILIPCHRIVSKDGTLAAFRWGLDRQQALLEREKDAGGLAFA